jgi:DNA-binding transcriptional LysR family regulator
MLKDFTKLETFLIVANERSFSKASAKLGISQPAVTQQIKFIEDYLNTKTIERKKNGIRLTKDGEALYQIALNLQKQIQQSEKDLLKIIDKELTFIIGSSYSIGNYILPNCLNDIREAIKNEVTVDIDKTGPVIESLLDRKIDIALVEKQIPNNNIVYREWFEDELVIFSNKKIAKYNNREDLFNYYWICREESSHTRKLLKEVFEDIGVDCKNFDVKSEVSGATMALNTVLKAKHGKDDKPTVSVISKHVIEDYVKNEMLFEGRLKGYKIKRKLYIAYLKERKYDPFIENVLNYLIDFRL